MEKKTVIAIFLAVSSFIPAFGQSRTEWRDSLMASTVTADIQKVTRTIEKLETDAMGIRSIVSPMGEGDIIRWAQGMPGVTTGADGSSAIYVRGGNMGNNLITLDGVPVYGYSHLIGLTTVIPSEIIGTASLHKGGFDSGKGNFTASHMDIRTRYSDAERLSMSVALSNFMASASVETPVGKDMSLLLAGRISPLALEYRAIRGLMPDTFDINGFNAGVGDAFVKYSWNIGDGRSIHASGLFSLDRYTFIMSEASEESMGWRNMIGAITYQNFGNSSKDFEAQISINSYSSSQRQVKEYKDAMNDLSILSEMSEATGRVRWKSHVGNRERLSLDYGIQARYAAFRPGQVASIKNESGTILASAHFQASYEIPERLSINTGVTGNWFRKQDHKMRNMPKETPFSSIGPDMHSSIIFHATRNIALEASVDHIRQYYHTLDGLPVGWSIDLIVPSSKVIAPESATQGNLETIVSIGPHSLSAGGFYKKMSGLIYCKQAETLFSGTMAAWEDYVDTGDGKSYGGEFLYEYQKSNLYGRVSYTISDTTRENFKDVNDGRPFNAKFNRRHVLNVTAQWKGFGASFVYQSGHWENGAAQTYTMHFPGEEWESFYYAGINNFQMPDVIRMDINYHFGFTKWDVRHDIQLGVCNLTNHFNPFMLYFDTRTESWKEIAILPILPNFSWRMKF